MKDCWCTVENCKGKLVTDRTFREHNKHDRPSYKKYSLTIKFNNINRNVDHLSSTINDCNSFQHQANREESAFLFETLDFKYYQEFDNVSVEPNQNESYFIMSHYEEKESQSKIKATVPILTNHILIMILYIY